jgi:hypothetical protein
MNPEVFAEWLRRQGHRVLSTPSSYWYEAGPRVLQAFPYHWLITPNNEELNNLMFRHRIIALRYSAPPDYYRGKMSYHIVQNKCYDIVKLKPQARNGIKCGLKKFIIEEIGFDRLARDGWILQEDTLARQNRLQSMTLKKWELLCHAAKDLPGFHAFAAISNGELAAAVIVCQIDNIYSVPYAMSHCRFLREHVNNALFYSVCCELLRKDEIKEIFFTVQSLDAPVNVDEFKLRMGFEARAVRQIVEIHPFLKPLVVPGIHGLTQKLIHQFPFNPLLAKADGMLRFYLEGRRPINEQSCPDCLKEEIKHL